MANRNLVLQGSTPLTNKNYCVAIWYVSPTEGGILSNGYGYLVAGQTYTMTICVTPANDITTVEMWLSTGTSGGQNTVFYVTGGKTQIISVTFKAKYVMGATPSDKLSDAQLRLYRFPKPANADAVADEDTTIHWVKIEQGSEFTGWSPAPEDVGVFSEMSFDSSGNMIFPSAIEVTRLKGKNVAEGVLVEPKIGETGTYTGYFRPDNTGKVTLGTSFNRWYRMYQEYASVSFSDARGKHDIIPIDQLPVLYGSQGENMMERFFRNLTPTIYCRNSKDKIENETLHIGFIAQDIANALKEIGIEENQIGVITHDFYKDQTTGKYEDVYGVSYEEIISLNTHMIKKAFLKIEELVNEINLLKEEVQKCVKVN